MKIKRLMVNTLIVLVLLFSAVGCVETTNGNTIYDISLSKSEITLEVGETDKLYAQYGIDGKIIFSSSNENVATVDESGVITGISVGIAYVDVSCGDEKKICKVEVIKSEYSIVLDCGDMNLFVGANKEIYATIYKNGVVSDLMVEWNVDNGGSLSVDENVAVFTATSAGTYTVTASFGGKSSQIVISVFNDASSI